MKTLGGVAGTNKAIDLREAERTREEREKGDDRFMNLDFVRIKNTQQ